MAQIVSTDWACVLKRPRKDQFGPCACADRLCQTAVMIRCSFHTWMRRTRLPSARLQYADSLPSRSPKPTIRSRTQHTSAEPSRLPRIAQASIWQSVVPRALREGSINYSQLSSKEAANPATYFIWIYLFIGSQAIRILSLQNEFDTYTRKADLKIGKLREVIEKLQQGKAVDVEKELGTGDEAQELEWEEALREIESEERLWQKNKRRRREEQARQAAEEQDANPLNGATVKSQDVNNAPVSGGTQARPALGFY